MAADDLERGPGQPRLISQKTDQFTVCAALQRRGCESHLQSPVVDSDDLVSSRPRLDSNHEGHTPDLPANPQ